MRVGVHTSPHERRTAEPAAPTPATPEASGDEAHEHDPEPESEDGSADLAAYALQLCEWLRANEHIEQHDEHRLGELAAQRNDLLLGAAEAFSMDQDLDELLDTLQRLLSLE